MEAQGVLAIGADALAEHRALLLIGFYLGNQSGLGIHTHEQRAVHVAEEAAILRPLDAILVDLLIDVLRHSYFLPLRLLVA
jgi:hypothetical protein